MHAALRDETPEEVAEAVASGLDANPCKSCEGRGEVECGTSTNDPDGPTWVDECEECGGSGNGLCPGCDELHAYLVVGDGRCSCCVGFVSVLWVEDFETAAQQVAA